jgi:Fe-S-cluster containining protein
MTYPERAKAALKYPAPEGNGRMPARQRRALSGANLRSEESLRLTYAMEDVATRLHGFAEIDSFAETGWLPDGFFGLLREFYAISDRYVYHNTVEAGMSITCQPKCGRCCHQPVRGLYSFEIINVYRRIRSLKAFGSIHRCFVDRASTYAGVVRDLVRSGATPAARGGSAEDVAQRNLMQAGHPCPLLRNRGCSIYADRPIVCRIYYSVTAPSFCTTKKGINFSIDYPPVILESLRQLCSRFQFMRTDEFAQSMAQFGSARKLRPWGPRRRDRCCRATSRSVRHRVKGSAGSDSGLAGA